MYSSGLITALDRLIFSQNRLFLSLYAQIIDQSRLIRLIVSALEKSTQLWSNLWSSWGKNKWNPYKFNRKQWIHIQLYDYKVLWSKSDLNKIQRSCLNVSVRGRLQKSFKSKLMKMKKISFICWGLGFSGQWKSKLIIAFFYFKWNIFVYFLAEISEKINRKWLWNP